MKDWELVNFCEFDKYAIKSYCAIHNEIEEKNLGDITKVDETQLKYFNMICGGSPCQDFSVAEKQKGSMWSCKKCGHEYNPIIQHYSKRDCCPNCGSKELDKSRSSLLVEWLRIIRANKPNWGIYENVKNIVSKQFKQTFDLFTEELKEYGYNTYWKVLNAKNYGIPQNRERVYLFIVKKELDNHKFKFPKPFDNGLRLKDMLESRVDKKYYLNNIKLDDLHISINMDISKTIRSSGRGSTDRHSWDLVQAHNKNFSTEDELSHSEWKSQMYEKFIRDSNGEISGAITNQSKTFGYRPPMKGFSKTLRANANDTGIVEGLNIRRLTPKECWRLMGFNDKDIDKCIELKISNSQLYKQAGNSIVVNVLYEIYKEIYKVMPYLFDDLKVGSYFSGIGAFEKALDKLYENINKK